MHDQTRLYPVETDDPLPAEGDGFAARALPRSLGRLTTREAEVLKHAMGGRTSKAIAYELQIADSTVRVLLWRAARRLGVRSRRELLQAAHGIAADSSLPCTQGGVALKLTRLSAKSAAFSAPRVAVGRIS